MDLKRKQTFNNYVLEKLKQRLKDDSAKVKAPNYKACKYTYKDLTVEDGEVGDIHDAAEADDTTVKSIEKKFCDKRKKSESTNHQRIYQASLPIEGLEVTREQTDSCDSDSEDSCAPKKRNRKRKRRYRHKKIMENCIDGEDEIPESIEQPVKTKLNPQTKEEKRLIRKRLRKEKTVATVQAGLRNEAYSLAKVWNSFFEARFTLVTETENVCDTLPETCNRVPTNFENCDEFIGTRDNSKSSERCSEHVMMKHDSTISMATSFEERYKNLEQSENSCEEKESVKTEGKQNEPMEPVTLTKNQRRKRRKKKRQFYLRKEEKERKTIEKNQQKELEQKLFEKSKEEVIAFYDSVWDIFLQEKSGELSHSELEKLRTDLLNIFDGVQNLQEVSQTLEMLMSVKKWLLLLDSNRARAVLHEYHITDRWQDDEFVIELLVEYWITDISPSLA